MFVNDVVEERRKGWRRRKGLHGGYMDKFKIKSAQKMSLVLSPVSNDNP
jgi:hypothetical protein